MAPTQRQRDSSSWTELATGLVNAMFRVRTPRSTGDEKEVRARAGRLHGTMCPLLPRLSKLRRLLLLCQSLHSLP